MTATDVAVLSVRCLPGGGEVVGKVGGGDAPAAAGASDAEGAGFECRGGGVLDPADGVAVGVERVGAGLGDGDRDRGLDAEQQRREAGAAGAAGAAEAAEQHRPDAGLRLDS